MCLTDVDCVKLDYGKSNEKDLHEVCVKDMELYAKQGHFAAGSMGPKINAAIRFINKGGQRAVITSLDNALQGFRGVKGTQVIP